MKSQYRKFLWTIPVLLALVGLVWIQPKHVSAQGRFGLSDFRGRYVGAGVLTDTSHVNVLATPNQSQFSSPLFHGVAEVIESDGRGNVFGESDLTIGAPNPRTIRTFYHGQYTVDGDGRVVITTCNDAGEPTMIGTDNTLCPATTNLNTTTLQVGYLQSFDGTVLPTVSSTPSGTFSSDIRPRVWSKASVDIDRRDLLTKSRDNDKDDHNKNKDRH